MDKPILTQAQTDYWNRPLFCIGMPRSGTSMAMGVLAACGLWIGTMRPPTPQNPKGFYENYRLERRIAEVCLGLAGADPNGVNPLPKLSAFKNFPSIRTLADFELRGDGYKGDVPWGFKSTKMTLSWPIWARAFPKARWLIVRRPADQVVSSCLRTPFLRVRSANPKFWQSSVAVYQQRIDQLKASGLAYDELWSTDILTGHGASLRPIADKLGLVWNDERVGAFIEPSYWGGRPKQPASG